VEWIDTKANIVSDLLSRFDIAEFLRQAALIGFPAPIRMQVNQGPLISGLADDVRTPTREAFAESTLSPVL
jgi:hypothetical protein